ncbi:MAG: VWA domain-containing protein [Pseudomonadales bacterium]|nr:VWA domain-containing protein [Pseudomonadales bacterium]
MSSSDKQIAAGSGKRPANKRELDAFLSKVAAMPAVATGGNSGRLLFALDATASREASWEQAKALQAEMFACAQSLGGLHMQLCYFRGFMDFYRSPWCHESSGLLQQMQGIQCQAGITQLERLLRHALSENKQKKVQALVFVGDAVEENLDVLAHLAGQLGLFNVPLFLFQEGADPVAEHALRELARLSGGAWSRFDSASVGQLKDLLRAVAVYAAGGLKALTDFSQTAHPAVKLLGRQLKA